MTRNEIKATERRASLL